MKAIFRHTQQFMQDDDGGTAVEYALLAAVISTGIVCALTDLASAISAVFTKVCAKLAAAIV